MMFEKSVCDSETISLSLRYAEKKRNRKETVCLINLWRRQADWKLYAFYSEV